MANCSQTNNTTIIGTSAVSYDSTPLPCTDVKACDNLNTILTKFDNVICSATNSVNILTEEITNITEDLMMITEEIENINDQIFICCPICDFTITATELPVCDFTATATKLPVCNFTGSANQLPDSTTTTTSSSSTSSSTTTTSTTTINCTFTGNANQLPNTTTTSTTTAAPTTTTTTSYLGCRPQELITLEYFNTYTYNDVIVDYTSSLFDACAACNFINDNPFDIQEQTSLFGQSATFAIGQTVYAGTGTSCDTLADGFYITDLATCEITEIVGGSIVDITYCSPTTTTTSSSTSTSSSSTTTTTTTVCVNRPVGLTNGNLIQAVNNGGDPSRYFANVSVAYACDTFNYFRPVPGTGSGTGMSYQDMQYSSLTIGEKIYRDNNETNCILVQDGYYWFQPDITNPLTYFKTINQISIVTTVNGVITAIDICDYIPTTTTTTTV
jgi:hypothetical protein